MKIGILQRYDTQDVRRLSGVPFYMAKALQERVGEVVHLGPDRSLLSRLIERAGNTTNHYCYSAFGRRISSDHNRILSSRLARVFKSRIARSGCDILFAPVAPAEVAFLETDVPIVYLSDLTWANIVDYYPICSSLFSFANREGERIERAALNRAAMLIFSSAWVANTAINHYGIAREKVHVVPYGANLDDPPSRSDALRHELREPIELLWVGVDWERKGGATAFDCLKKLQANGADARLTVCGCTPPKAFEDKNLRVIPFLDKTVEQDRKAFAELYLNAHFFLFPTLAEAFGIVLCESAAYGLPALARNTGGVREAVTDGQNGFLMPPDVTGMDYAHKIEQVLGDPALYRSLVVRSRDMYEQRLNWNAWGRSVRPLFEEVLTRHAAGVAHERMQ